MKLDLCALLADKIRTMPVSFELNKEAEAQNSFSGLNDVRFTSPVRVEGSITNTAGYIRMSLTLSVDYVAACARCLNETQGSFSFDVERTVVTPDMTVGLTEDRIDELVVVEDGFLDIDALLLEVLELSIPFRFLCREDCKGLCSRCGKNLNEGDCGCETKEIDPRLEPLRELLQKMKAKDSE